MQDLGTLGGSGSDSLSVSADGSVVVGWAFDTADRLKAFRWTAGGGMEDLGTLGGTMSAGWGVSADGSVFVGWARNAAHQARAFRWECVSPACPADLNGDGVLDFFDVQAFLNFYATGNLVADFTGDGVLDFFDVQAFLNLYAAGCP